MREHAFVDANGDLHLRITHAKGKWCAAEIVSDLRLGFGTCQFQLKSRVDLLDRNVVLGLFNYPTADVGADGTQIDIEFARWGASASRTAVPKYGDPHRRLRGAAIAPAFPHAGGMQAQQRRSQFAGAPGY